MDAARMKVEGHLVKLGRLLFCILSQGAHVVPFVSEKVQMRGTFLVTYISIGDVKKF